MCKDDAETTVYALDVDNRVSEPALHRAAGANPAVRVFSPPEEWVVERFEVAGHRVNWNIIRVCHRFVHDVFRNDLPRMRVLPVVDRVNNFNHCLGRKRAVLVVPAIG